MKRLVVKPEAEQDIEEIYAWYCELDKQVAGRFITSLEAALAHIAEAPEAFPRFGNRARAKQMGRYPYRIIYYEEVEVIFILAVFHMSRDITHNQF